jgi:hypothetical protein
MRIDRTTFLVALGGMLALAACGGPPPAPGAEAGIEVLGIALRGGGEFALLNYRVLDYDKAKRTLQQDLRLVGTGAEGAPLPVTSVGRLGPMRQRPSASGRTQFILFTNAGRVMRKGSVASLLVGDLRIDGIPVT